MEIIETVTDGLKNFGIGTAKTVAYMTGGVATGLLFVGACAAFVHGCGLINSGCQRMMEYDLEQNSVVPSEIELKLQDINGDGELDSVMQIRGREYFMKYDADRRPYFELYTLKKK